ncbi:hypothetical protein GCM10023340_08900 [Nocardioides marinquilinus]|uniref:Cholesterol esterase n=1 Tax=Nocardioides marinquilinus TaxID=1210400 RepID=A0ABP9PAG6_9ACTN
MTRRPLALPSVAPSLVVMVLALLLACASTSYAAGVAAGSVGTKQLRDRAVTTAKIKPGAVTGGSVRDGSLTARDLARGTVAPPSVTVARAVGDLPETQVLAMKNLRFGFACDATQRLARLVVTSVSGRLDRVGNEIVRSGGTQSPRSVVNVANTLTVLGEPAPAGLTASTTFEGTIQAAGSPAVRVTVGLLWSPSSSTPCTLRLTATPTG